MIYGMILSRLLLSKLLHVDDVGLATSHIPNKFAHCPRERLLRGATLHRRGEFFRIGLSLNVLSKTVLKLCFQNAGTYSPIHERVFGVVERLLFHYGGSVVGHYLDLAHLTGLLNEPSAFL